jgi:hypothetical protein
MNIFAWLKNNVSLLIAITLIAIIIVPPIAYDYTYPNLSDDTAEHLKAFEKLELGQPFPKDSIYYGQVVTGLALKQVSRVVNINVNTLFLWFNFIVLLVSMLTIYMLSTLIHKKAWLIIIPLAMFCSNSILSLFEHGIIFNIINMYIILVVIIYCLTKWIVHGSKVALIMALPLSLSFAVFHSSALYLPLMLTSSIIVISVYCLFKKEYKMLIRTIVPFVAIGAISIVLIKLTLNSVVLGWTITTIRSILDLKTNPITGAIAPPTIIDFLITYLSPIVIIIFYFSIIMAYKIKDKLKLEMQTKVVLLILTSFAIPLAIGSFTRLTHDPTRIAYDLAGITGLLIGCIVAITAYKLQGKKVLIFRATLAICLIIGAFPLLHLWFGYNSAIKPADRQAIEYLNAKSNGTTYSCDAYTADWIYSRYINLTYVNGGSSDYYITRNMPMTPRTDPQNPWFVSKELPDILQKPYKATEFVSGETKVIIIERLINEK